jgi:hypothetical protein
MSYTSKYIFIIPLSIFFTFSLVYLFIKHHSESYSNSHSDSSLKSDSNSHSDSSLKSDSNSHSDSSLNSHSKADLKSDSNSSLNSHSDSPLNSDSNSDSNSDNHPKPRDNYSIKPLQFDIGIMKQDTYKSSNLCNNTVLKPIIPVNVDYGWEMPENCPCCKYIEPP